MKFNFDFKNKKAGFEADVEKIAEKAMEHNEKDWEEKFDKKHNAKKEILEIKHKQKMEAEDKNQTKKNWIQKIQEEHRKTKELELEEERRREEEERKIIKTKMIISLMLGMLSLVMMIIGCILGTLSGDSDSGWYMIACVGFFPLLGIVFIWSSESDKKKKKNKK